MTMKERIREIERDLVALAARVNAECDRADGDVADDLNAVGADLDAAFASLAAAGIHSE